MAESMAWQTSYLAARWGQNPGFAPDKWNSTLETIVSHRSVRRWLNRDVNVNTIRTLAAAAQSASTSSNKQIVSMVAVRDIEMKNALGEVASSDGSSVQARQISTAPVVFVWLLDTSRIRHAVQWHRKEDPESEYTGLQYIDEAFVGVCDIGIAGQNTVVAAESLGLGAVFLGSLRSDAERVGEILNVPDHVVPFLGLAIGHPDPEEPAGIKPRIPPEAFLHWDSYNPEAAIDVAAYDDTLAEYYSRYGLPSFWRRQMASRVNAKNVESRKRHLLRDVFEKAGFGLK